MMINMNISEQSSEKGMNEQLLFAQFIYIPRTAISTLTEGCSISYLGGRDLSSSVQIHSETCLKQFYCRIKTLMTFLIAWFSHKEFNILLVTIKAFSTTFSCTLH